MSLNALAIRRAGPVRTKVFHHAENVDVSEEGVEPLYWPEPFLYDDRLQLAGELTPDVFVKIKAHRESGELPIMLVG